MSTTSPSHSEWELFDALEREDVACVRTLLDADPSLVHARDSMHQSVIRVAAQSGNLSIVNELLARGAPPDGEPRDFDTPLCDTINSSHSGWKNVFNLLVDHGADLERTGLDGTPLQTAVLLNRRDAVIHLLDSGANVNTRSAPDMTTPIWYAAFVGNCNLVEELLRHGADPFIQDAVVQLDALGVARRYSPIEVREQIVAVLRRHIEQ